MVNEVKCPICHFVDGMNGHRMALLKPTVVDGLIDLYWCPCGTIFHGAYKMDDGTMVDEEVWVSSQIGQIIEKWWDM